LRFHLGILKFPSLNVIISIPPQNNNKDDKKSIY
jgi:hypothetical protein